jgi:hypothetical protein
MSTLYTIKYIDNGWGHRLSLIELNVISFIFDNFCVTKIKYIAQNVEDYSVHHYAVHLVICEGWHFTHTWKAPASMQLRWQVYAHNTSFAPSLFIEINAQSQEGAWSCICVLEVSILPLYEFSIGFWKCSDSVVFLEMFRQCGIFRNVSTVWYF